MKSGMRVGVRFCGGCNPRYDRGETYRELQESLPGVVFAYLVPGRSYDGYLLVCGCQSQCAGRSEMDKELPVFVLTSPEEIKEAAAFFLAAASKDRSSAKKTLCEENHS